jgi:hypothetical protein
MNIENALRFIRPEPVFHGRLFTQDDYETKITWADARPKPTWAEIEQAWIGLQASEVAKAQAEADELTLEEFFHTKYGLTTMKNSSLVGLEATTKNILGQVGGASKAIEMLATAVALIDRRITRRGL